MRTNVLRGLLGAGIISGLLCSGWALAQNGQGQNNDNQGTRTVPEFDPAAIGGIAALVAGGGVLLARRRKVK
jgi:LPXTG-motif cell wall-anchored protein